MKEIQLTNGGIALIDDKDGPMVARASWYAHRNRHTFYAETKAWPGANGVTTRMHRVILNAPPGIECDHVNHNGLDNRRSNLRLCTRAENQHNQPKRTGHTSKFKGVCRFRNRWQAYLRVSGKKQHLGTFATAEEAALAYNNGAQLYYGEFAWLNPV